jgi:S-formylglutathione hydrolase FrmB
MNPEPNSPKTELTNCVFLTLAKGICFAGICLAFVSCSIIGRPLKRARMATAVFSETITPLSAPFRPTDTLPPPLMETSTPKSVLSCPERAGTIRPLTINSSATGGSLGFFIYLPPCYSADNAMRLPAVFLFHGLGRTPDQWLDLGLAETADNLILSGQIPPLLIMLPYIPGEDSNDAAFLADLLPEVDRQFRTEPDRAHRAIGGVSRGAEWALRLALRRPDLFGAVGMHSISPSPNALVDIYQWAQAVPESLWPRIYFDAGYSDPQLQEMLQILNVFDLLNRPYEKHIPPGDHSDAYWGANINQYLLWYSSNWN